ncbi:acid-sensing ion channel 1 isoform X2 [Brachionus plicatilis]|uniref:Acid-sensing ion channel 1 isoform X2 n=1 Tax=Brachionus plicatilis TaxID=10195 RepID=A0A3M7RF80_BRAPC|nr:acid-sensing ion channel 1 isoform X2 [Brachionus plicatilis]
MKPKINFQEKLFKWCERTSFHAVPNIATNEHIVLKCMWSICLVASLGYCCRILTSSIIDFYEYNVLTTFEIVQESSSLFPVITICNLNEYDLSKNQQLLNLSNYLLDNADMSLHPRDAMDQVQKNFLKLTNITELEETRFDLGDMLLSCHYNEIACSVSDFSMIKNELYGNCYSFNMVKNNSIRTTSKYGPKYGLQMELYIGNADSSSPMSLTTGVILFINNQTSPVRITDPGIELSPGTQTNIAVNRMFIYKLPQPYSDCVENTAQSSLDHKDNLVQMTFEMNHNYTQSFCLELCYESYLLNECNCSDGDITDLIGNYSDPCHADKQSLLCFYDMKSKFFDWNFNENCKMSCPIECERVTFKIASLSTAVFPSLFYEKILLNNSFIKQKFKIDSKSLGQEYDDESTGYYEDFRKSLLSVNIYYDTDTYEKVTETPETSFGTLLANLGGQFGLFLGKYISAQLFRTNRIVRLCQILFYFN